MEMLQSMQKQLQELKSDVATITDALVTMRDASRSPMVKDALAELTSASASPS